MFNHHRKIVYETLLNCTLRDTWGWTPKHIQDKLDSSPLKLRQLKPFLPEDEYKLLKDSYDIYVKTKDSNPWWETLRYFIEKYKEKPRVQSDGRTTF